MINLILFEYRLNYLINSIQRIKLELEKEKQEQLEKLKKVAEIKTKNRAQLEARLSNQQYNIDYTRDRKEIKLKYLLKICNIK